MMYLSDHEQTQKVNSLLDEAYQSRVNDLKKSIMLASDALELSIKMDETSLIARCKSRLSLFYMICGEYARSMELGEEAIGLFEVIEDDQGIADSKYNIASIYYKTDNFHLGLIYMIDCLEIYRRLEDYHNQARVQKSLGTIYEYFGDEKSAILAYEHSIEAARKVSDLNLESNVYNPLSGIYLNQNNIEKASELIEKSIHMKTQTNDVRGLAFALYGKAKVYVKRKQYDLAEQTFKESEQIHKEMGEKLGSGMCFHKLGQLYVETREFDKAEQMLNHAIRFSAEYNIVITKFKCNYLMYKLFKLQDNPTEALIYLERYLSEKEGVINTQTQKVIESYEAITTMERLQKEAQMQREKAEILEKKNRAEQSSRVKQEFLSTMSHEIRTPLNAVITITSLLEERVDGEENQLIESLKFSANNLLLIINDILDFSKLDLGKVKLENDPTDFKGLLTNIKNTYQSMAREKGVAISLSIDEDLDSYYSLDGTKLSQIMGNLVSNAIKFTDEGQVDINVKKLSSANERDQIEISVADTGVGIPEDFLDEVFDSFSQPRSYTTKKQGGSGLGLAIVKKLIDLHGSNIQVESELGKGSRFYFEIGLVKSGAPVNTSPQESKELHGKTVLIAEDNMINAMVSMKLMGNWGLNTSHAKNGYEAIEMAKAKSFDFILMDIHMPELDGFDAAREIRSTINPNTKTPILALTADITAHQRKLFEPYFDGFLLKPIDKEKLFSALSSGEYLSEAN
ncbi:MAG: ATP-binding protein [Marinoscillum sp.]